LSETNVTHLAILVTLFTEISVIKKERSLVSKNSNSLNAMIKRTSVTINNSHLKKIAFLATAIIMLSAVGTFGFSLPEDAFAKKPGSDSEGPISWSNGFPSGPHWNLNIHGKKIDPFYNCDNSPSAGPFGASVFLPLNTTEAAEEFPQYNATNENTIGKINFVSNKRSNVQDLTVLDPCGAPFGNQTHGSVDEILVQFPKDAESQVYWRILGKPFHGQGPDKGFTSAMITHPALLDQCNFIPSEFLDGTTVNFFDPDVNEFSNLRNFESFERFENFTVPDAGFSITETIYNDTNPDGIVSIGDIRLANAVTQGFVDDSIVAIGNVDLLNVTYAFPANIWYNDTNGDGFFSKGETVYNSTNGVIDAGDVRLANAVSQGLSEELGGNEISCEDTSLIGLGLVSNKGVFDLEDDQTLVRFGSDDNKNEKGQGGKKGKSVAMNITGLFQWSGFVCDATELDGNDDNKLTFGDFDVIKDGVINATDIAVLNQTAIFGAVFTEATILAAEDFVDADDDLDRGPTEDAIDPGDEFDAWIDIILRAIAVGGFTNDDGLPICVEFTSEWIFNVADIVLYGFDYENHGSSLTQIRFYPINPMET